MPPGSPPNRLMISFLDLRKSIGYLGVTMPIVLVLGNYFTTGSTDLMSSLSSYYHSGGRNFFIAVLAAIAVFAFAYRGYDTKDNIAGDIAAVSALVVAFFPAGLENPDAEANPIIGMIHIGAALIFFLTLAYFSLVLFPKTDPNKPMSPQKKKRNKVYRLSGYVILGSLVLIGLYEFYLYERYISLQDYKPIFWLESIAIVAFGLSWLTKGEAILADEI